jgi:hypothetical protein
MLASVEVTPACSRDRECRPESSRMPTLVLLEPSILSMPGAQAFLQKAGPALEAYAAGDHEKALVIFMTAVSGLDWKTCRALVEERIPGAVADALKDAGTFFGVELPALTQWTFDARSAAVIFQPALSVVGTETQPPVEGDCRAAPRLAPSRRGVQDRGRRSPLAHPASRTGSPRDRTLPGAPRHEPALNGRASGAAAA